MSFKGPNSAMRPAIIQTKQMMPKAVTLKACFSGMTPTRSHTASSNEVTMSSTTVSTAWS